MKLQSPLSFLNKFAVVTLPLLLPACGGGGGGGSAGALGGFTSDARVLAFDPGDMEATVTAGASGQITLGAFARDSARNVFYAVDEERSQLVRLDARGRVTIIGALDVSPTGLVHDPVTGLLIGVRNQVGFLPSQLVHIDPATAETSIIGTTPEVAMLTLDRDQRRLLAILRNSSGSTSNTLVEIDVDTGFTQSLFDNVSFSTLRGITFDPVTRSLFGVDGRPGATLFTFDLGSQLIEGAVFFERSLERVVVDEDAGTLFALGASRGQLLELSSSGQTGEAHVLATLARELSGLTFDPEDERFFAIDRLNGELVKVAPTSGDVTSLARLPLLPTDALRDVRTLAYDPVRRSLFGIERNDGQVLSIDPSTAECTEIGRTVSIDMIFALDQVTGRLFGFDQNADVLIEIDPDSPATLILLDNATGLTDVEDLAFDPVTQRLVALHEAPGPGINPMVSSIGVVSSTATVPVPELRAPRGLTAFGLDSRTGLYHGFGPRQPRFEFELDLVSGSALDSSARSLDGAWRTNFRAALRVPSLDAVFAVDADGLYRWNPRERTMTRAGNLPSGVNPSDLVFDPTTGYLGLREDSSVTWIRPTIPFSSVGAGATVPPQGDLRITCDPSTGNLLGVDSGALVRISFGSTVTTPVTPAARQNFTAGAVAYSPAQNAVYALGTDAASGTREVVRFDATTGEWTDAGSLAEARALFAN